MTGDIAVVRAFVDAMAERAGATVAETPASHSVYLSQPQAVADLIKQAAGATR